MKNWEYLFSSDALRLPMAKVEDPNKPGSETSSVSSGRMSPGLPLFNGAVVDHNKIRYPHCVVWTPIPMLT